MNGRQGGLPAVIDRPTPVSLNLGFLTAIAEGNGHMGGYLVTNAWGRPLEFRLTTCVQPNRVQEILYGATLREYVLADLIGKTLVEKTATQPTLVVVDSPALLSIRSRIDIPVVAVSAEAIASPDALSLAHPRSKHPVLYPVKFADDGPRIARLLDAVDAAVELSEPFSRVREAIVEARKMGVTSRAA
jgi:hypothetical protein